MLRKRKDGSKKQEQRKKGDGNEIYRKSKQYKEKSNECSQKRESGGTK